MITKRQEIGPSDRTSTARPSSRREFSQDVERPLYVLKHTSVDVLCPLNYGRHKYSLYLARCPIQQQRRHPFVLISAGVHGNEPAGVYAALEFLETVAPRWSKAFNFVVLPCVNPSGFEADTLETMSGENLNRLFGTGTVQPEIVAVEKWLADEAPWFRMTFDLHETPPDYRGEGFVEEDNPRACYLYETTHEKRNRIGRRLIDSLPETTEVCRWPRIYLDENVDGLISYPEASNNPVYMKGTAFDAYLNGRYTAQSLTTETPTIWSFEKRIETHLIWLETALELICSKKEG